MAMEAKAIQEQRPVPVMAVDILPTSIDREIEKAKLMRQALDKLFDQLLEPGTDYDRIPGTDKPTLLKPGAELLCKAFRLAPGKPEMVSCQEDFQAGVFSYVVCVPIYHIDSGVVVAYGVGAANSKEPKYRYRKSKEDRDVRTENPDPAGDQNTLVKMAAKRAFIDGVLKATGASRKFTQDAEDLMPPEKASTNQVNYIRSLFRGKKDDEILAAIGEMLDRELDGWGDLTREEASQVIDAKKAEQVNGQKRRVPDAPKPADRANRPNWSAFWKEVKEMGLTNDAVHEEARRFFGQPELGSLTEVISDQTALDDFLAHLKELFGGKSATA